MLVEQIQNTDTIEAIQTPAEVVPSASNELLLQVQGGSVKIEDVSVTDHEEVSLRLNEEYLVAVRKYARGRAHLAANGEAVFVIRAGGVLAPVGDSGGALVSDMLRQYNNRLNYLRDELKVRRGPQ